MKLTSSMLCWAACWVGIPILLVAALPGQEARFPTPADQKVLDRRKEIAAKVGPEIDAMRRQLHGFDDELAKGNYSAIDRLTAEQNLPMLWFLFQQAYGHGLGSGVISKKHNHSHSKEWSDELLAFNDRIRMYVGGKLASIPGHAKYLGDMVEEMSREAGYFGMRTGLLVQLGELGSMEAIQQLGRFMEDERNPEENFWPDETDIPNTSRNWHAAAPAMHIALGKLSPAKPSHEGAIDGRYYKTIQDWWKSDAAKPYREWKFETHEPMSPPRLRAKPLMGVQPEASTATPPPLASGSSSGMPIWLLIALSAGGIAAATFFAVRRGKR